MSNSASMRIANLLDDGSFVELGSYITARSTDFNLQQKETPADGCLTGYGTIEGNLVYVYSQDASVLGGSIGEMHAKKIANVYALAMKMGAPVIGLVDCAGLRLQEATDALNAFGQIYLSQVQASGVIPQITAVLGTCGGGMAVVPALTDFTFMETKSGKLFLNSPNAIDGNEISKCNTSSAAWQEENTGEVDMTGDEADLINSIRTLISILPANNEDDMSYDECTDDLNRACENLEAFKGDTAEALAEISDNRFFFEVKKGYCKSMVTGFIRLNGTTVGAVANRSEVLDEEGNAAETYDAVLSAAGCEKAAKFVNFCDAFGIPVLTLVNVKGMQASICQEKKLPAAMAKMTYAFANATVPKVSVVIGEAYGSAYVAMNSKSIGADVVFSWPDASIGMMDATNAVKIIYADEINASEQASALISEKAAEYANLQSSPLSAARRGYVDNIIEPQDTRKYVIGAFEMLFTKREDRPAKKHGSVM
ncbi:acyl-CoA carboxylase subunit beta [Lachnotalea sp. AF33-28]|uniref:acyl-CoA carboxylase subunit beta n=1 Tax=Lachnotalea sp. AF33-28 TaxID=2292046 RepID=UPI000E53F4D4|nr:carboxyl transferase domain-containing protein [Lachnotalea sp. AF33-28]RHP34358.1 carboxyl transferase [Lachnotalea sp. AF33-28]